MFLSFPPNPLEMCVVLGQDCPDRLVPGPVPAPMLSLLLRSPQLYQPICQTVLLLKFKNEGSTKKSTKKSIAFAVEADRQDVLGFLHPEVLTFFSITSFQSYYHEDPNFN